MAAPPTTELTLEADLKSQDPARFAVLYKRFSNALYGILLSIVKDEDEAQDLLQDAFVKIWRNAAKYERSKGTVFTWMLNIARNQAIDFLRSKRAGQAKQSFSLEESVYIAETVPAQDASQAAGQEAAEYLALLPEAQRKLMHMVYVEGYTHAEVADQTGLPLGTVKTRIRTALQSLRMQV
jgi:RNA polymerase sigma-70 factor (ECF subfamily)